ncbi:DDE 3 domain containing protein [Asbolus verrucosus]|uniref:DDE 3 domain containing protein n=1 Tax=Asbolus verrucosus TaxID=1661398 RepID=A0A482W6C2_ASBVE|nr:DDE 3 domain containing protein [Asbolus verrucosus]
MLNVFRTGRDRSLRFSVLSNSLLPKELFSLWRILKHHKYHPYHISLHQDLHGTDLQNRLTFYPWAGEQIQMSPNFFRSVLFSDESTFTNMHYWSVQNSSIWLCQIEHQGPWSVNVWWGIIGDKLLGPHIIEGNLSNEMYQDFLDNELPQLPEDVSLGVQQNIWFQPHDRDFHGRWIGPIKWPARSPDLTSPDFFLWGYLKDKVYQQVPITREDMIE